MSEERKTQEPLRIEKSSNLHLMEAMQRAFESAQTLDIGERKISDSESSPSDQLRRQQ